MLRIAVKRSKIHLKLLENVFKKNDCKRVAFVSTSLQELSEASTIYNNDIPNLIKIAPFENKKHFMSAYHDLMTDLKEDDNIADVSDVKHRLIRALKHTVQFGLQADGYGVLSTYKLIESPQNLTEKNIRLAAILTWCNTIMAAHLILDDDIMDNESTRKGLPCWHTLENNKLIAINDSSLMEGAVCYILRKYFFDHPNYLPMAELIHAANFTNAVGQSIKMQGQSNGKPRFDYFTPDVYNNMAYYTSTNFAYEMPITLAMYLAQKFDPELHKQAKSIASRIGFLFIVHNDVVDSYCAPEVAGKASTDIANGRCSWLAVQTLQRGTSVQKETFMKHYGKSCFQSQQIVKNIYRELNLSEAYLELETETIKLITEEIEQIAHRLLPQIFYTLLSDVTLYRKGYIDN